MRRLVVDRRHGVSIHAPARGATVLKAASGCASAFRSTLPRGERPCDRCVARVWRSFDPRSRAGSDGRLGGAGRSDPVSIHAPARGATDVHHRRHPDLGVSIHAPARGATVMLRRMGGVAKVSIHAPARGATEQLLIFLVLFGVSIHAPARGATCATAHRVPSGEFRSTLPRGERLVNRVGTRREIRVSIHAPARGATLSGDQAVARRGVSIHAPARGATTLPQKLSARA
ncbi:hypothetical protein RPYSC3_24010 [Rhodopseudomonas palustris]|nr:hypothetical protein RPYSC3_24010 [Rhodopseudomonas palustris]